MIAESKTSLQPSKDRASNNLSVANRHLKVKFAPADTFHKELKRRVDEYFTTHLFWLILAIIFCMPVYHKAKGWIDKKVSRINFYDTATIGFNVVLLFLCVAQLVGKSYNPFIYFRF